jgi:hypothetical protein
MGFQSGSKGITRNGDASHVWKEEMVQIAFSVGHFFSACPFFVSKIP